MRIPKLFKLLSTSLYSTQVILLSRGKNNNNSVGTYLFSRFVLNIFETKTFWLILDCEYYLTIYQNVIMKNVSCDLFKKLFEKHITITFQNVLLSIEYLKIFLTCVIVKLFNENCKH